jgi:hypothetical protein
MTSGSASVYSICLWFESQASSTEEVYSRYYRIVSCLVY